MWKVVQVTRGRRVAVLKDGVFSSLLPPGKHVLWTLGSLVELVEVDVSQSVERVPADDPLPVDVEGAARVVVADGTRGVVRVDGVVSQVLGPGTWRIWSGGAGAVATSFVDVGDEPVALSAGDVLPVSADWLEGHSSASSVLVLRKDGAPVKVLEPGRYRWWRSGPWDTTRVDTSMQTLELPAQDLVTRDQVPVRVKAAAIYRVVDPMRFVSEPHADTLLYGAIHLVLREVIAARTLDGLVEAREDLSADQLARAVGALPDVGIRLSAAWVKDVILPGEVKDLVARVTMARKDAEANAIRRREEVASTRQLANTAKLLEGNPILLRLKELEALGELVGKIDKLVVVGGGDLARHVMLRSTEL